MKQRLISSAFGLGILLVALLLFNTIAVNFIMAAIALLAVYELLAATGCWKYRMLAIPAMIFTAIIPFFSVQMFYKNIFWICYLYVFVLAAVLLRYHRKLHIEQIAVSFMCSLMIPFSLTTLIYQRDRWGVALGIFYVLLSLGSAFLSDTGAYFAGRLFGRHKLAPYISPKKTVEGAVGGAIFAAATTLLVIWLYSLAAAWMGYPIEVNYWLLLCLMPVLSAASIVGDLFASIIKRQYNVKDYGSIMPGHGGVMDRFDSVLMVAPIVFIASRYLPLAQMAVK